MECKILYKNKNCSITLCTNFSIGEQYIVKTFTFGDNKKVYSFYNELIIERLEHPCLLKIIKSDLTNTEGKIYYKYIPNTICLFDLIQKNISLNIKNKIALQLIDVIVYLRSKNIVHRDIKPGNILIDFTSFPNVYLIDFEFSCEDYDRTKYPEQKNSSFFNPTRSYTPNFASPLTLKGDVTSYSVDIYALGITLLCLYCETKTPYGNLKDIDEIFKIKETGGIEFRDDKIVDGKGNDVCNLEIIKTIPLKIQETINKMIKNVTEEPINICELRDAFM